MEVVNELKKFKDNEHLQLILEVIKTKIDINTKLTLIEKDSTEDVRVLFTIYDYYDGTKIQFGFTDFIDIPYDYILSDWSVIELFIEDMQEDFDRMKRRKELIKHELY